MKEDALDVAIRLESCLRFFRSVIQSGEGWTKTCQEEYDKVQEQFKALMADFRRPMDHPQERLNQFEKARKK